MRLMQNKRAAFWFYRFLSIFYDNYVNPLFWTEEMRDSALELAQLNDTSLKVIDVGSGTGFTTQGIVTHIDAGNVTCIDQSPHQMSKAKNKKDLQQCHFELGDAEDLPVPTDHFDRYVSAGSIEYWPDPAKGIREAYRVIRPGGIALMIGPLEPGNRFSRFIAKLWMLFPSEAQYRLWFEAAGFTDIAVKYVRPHWYEGDRYEYGIAISGIKKDAGLSPNVEPGERPDSQSKTVSGLQLIWRVIVGSLAGFVFIPLALLGYLKSSLSGKKGKKLTRQQVFALFIILAIVVIFAWLIFK